MIGQTDISWAWPWWTTMVIINIGNLIVAMIVYKKSLKFKDEKDPVYLKRMRIMGAIVVIVSLYRAIFVSQYGSQLAWFDSIANSALLIRLFASVAEVSFSGLFALAILKFNTYLPAKEGLRDNKFKLFITTKTPYVLITCIIISQFVDTFGVITKHVLANAIVETLWSIGFLAILPLAILQLRRVLRVKDKEKTRQLLMLKKSAIIIVSWCLIYCLYGLVFHLPGIWSNTIYLLETGIPPIKTGINAIIEAFTVVNETKLYSDWGFGFLLWHSAYFSICTWISIFLMQAPRPRDFRRKYNPKINLMTVILIIIALITLLTLLGLPAEFDDILVILVLGGIVFIPIAFILFLEIKDSKSKV
ncbi:MAG: hypothetical protein ACP6IY_20035 [Promethearchaeia archaeon]